MQTGKDIVHQDLSSMCSRLEQELKVMSGHKLLITGGAGFLGYYLVQVIDHWNQEYKPSAKIGLTIYDNMVRGKPEWLSQLENRKAIKLLTHDIRHPLPSDMDDDFSFIIHAASIASPTFYRKHPIETMDANVNGLRRLLEYCKKQKEDGRTTPLGFLFYSSSEVYGDPAADQIPTSESYNGNVSFTGPRACYDESKRFGETLCVNFAQRHELPIKIVRPFNNYGPGLKISDRRVIPDFARNIFDNENIVMLSDGKPTRTFCYVADAVVGYYKALVSGRPGQAYNIGTETPEISMAELAKQITVYAKELFGYGGKVILKISEEDEYLVDNPNRRCPRIDKARSELGFVPVIGLEEGLKRSLLWYADNRQSEDA
ncbi:MAG: NAD-dependent epimerase/dehydratase family protein [Desulfobacteraceae bacterium]|nr:NAD-dependent epimerase/dehydratase family protein [Desulfobacteraceae bacterium]